MRAHFGLRAADRFAPAVALNGVKESLGSLRGAVVEYCAAQHRSTAERRALEAERVGRVRRAAERRLPLRDEPPAAAAGGPPDAKRARR